MEDIMNSNVGREADSAQQDHDQLFDDTTNSNANDDDDDSLLTDDEQMVENELSNQHHVQGPLPLHLALEYVKCSRDIDSISVLSPSVSCLIRTMESKSVVKLLNTVGDIPTTSSRHCVKQKLRNRDGTTQMKKTPLHHFQNISLGTVMANNIRFHLVIYCIQHEGIGGKTKGYRPMTTNKRFVIVAALNLARMIQCDCVQRIKREWTEFCNNELQTLGEAAINFEDVSSSLLNIISYRKQSSWETRHSQHWVSCGEIFCLRNDAVKASEVSTTRDHSYEFFVYFEASLELIANGILYCKKVWDWCFAKVDINVMKRIGASICSKYSFTEAAKNSVKHFLFGLTAAGIKGDFPKYSPFHFQGETEAASASQHFIQWLHEAGEQNMKNVHACFDNDFDFDNYGVTITVDDGLTFDATEKKIMLLPSFDSTNQVEIDDENSSNVDLDINYDYNDDDDDDDYNDDDNDSHLEDNGDNDHEFGDSGGGVYIDVAEDDESENEESNSLDNLDMNDQRAEDTPMEERVLDSGNIPMAARMLATSKPNKYPILLHPVAASFHTGKIVCSLVYTDASISHIQVKGVGNCNVSHGDTVGYQGYLTSMKNTKGAVMFKNISRLGFLEKASFGLLHSSLDSDEKGFRELMDKCLHELDNLDFSKSALSDSLRRSFCFRLECFRCFTSLHNEIFDQMHDYSYDVLHIPVFIGHKDKMLRNYFNTLSLAKEVITRVFTVDKAGSDNHFDVRKLSPSAKTGIQFLSEILTFDVGTPSGYSRRGPIIDSLISTDESMKLFGIHYPANGIELDNHEASLTGLPHGIDPKHWNLVDEELNLHDEVIRILGYTETSDNQLGIAPLTAMNAREMDKLRRQLGKRLFRFKTSNKDRDKCSWQLLVTHFILAATGDSVDGSVFGSDGYESLVKLVVNNKTKEIECILERIAHIFWLCYDWEWRADLLTNRNFRHLEVPLGDWPGTIGGLSIVLGGLAQPKNTNKTVDSVAKLEGELFQHHAAGGSATEKVAKSASWKSCTHLHLYRYILKILAMARDKLYERSHANQSANYDQSIHMLSTGYFFTKMSRTLMRRSGHGDMPYVWKTTKGNRKKDIGKFVAVDVKSLEKSIEFLELQLNRSNHHRVQHSSQKQRMSMQMLHNLNHKNLHGILMKIPYDLSSLNNGSNKSSRRQGTFLSVAHVLVTSLLSLGVEQNSREICWTKLLAVDASRIYQLLQVDDPLSNVTLAGSDDKINVARVSNIHLLWDSRASFVSSSNKIKGAIRSRLGKKRNDMLPNAVCSFQLEYLETAVRTFSFNVVPESIWNMINSGNGRFYGVNDRLVIQLKVLCLVLYMDDVQQKRKKASRMQLTSEPYSYEKRLRHFVQFCHEDKYLNFVREFNSNN